MSVLVFCVRSQDSNPDDDYEDPEIKINNKGLMAFSTTSGTSSGSSSGHRSNNTQQSAVSVHANNGTGSAHYDSFRTMATINAYTPTPAGADGVGVYNSGGGTPHHVNLPSNNYHQNNSNYGGLYGSRNYGHNTLRQLPSRMEYRDGTVAVSAAPGNTKFWVWPRSSWSVLAVAGLRRAGLTRIQPIIRF